MIDYIPSKEEKLKLKKEVSGFLKKFKGLKDVKFTLGGSYAKDTWLPGNKDVDVFAKFNYSKFKGKDISLKLFSILKKKYKNILVVHGSRDYFHIMVNDTLFEVVPVLDIKKVDKAENIMDVSPFHVNYVKKIKRKDDIRKLKLLLKAQHLYGAESYLQGFSGYVCELLISYYGSFSRLIKSVSKWEDSLVIDVGKHYSSKSIALKSLNKSKLGPLVLIDPVDSSRNAAASVSLSKFKEFVKVCSEFFDDSFVLKEVDVSKLKGYIVLSVVRLEGKRDIALAKMRALFDRILREFSYSGFKVKDSGWDSSHYWFKVSKLSKDYRHYGPLVSMKEHSKAFRKKYGRKVKVSRGRCYVVLKRKYVDPREFLKDLIKEKFVKEKVKKIRVTP
jgi:tRNA nucleotidyltransferase (CCA-adding enzyme)